MEKSPPTTPGARPPADRAVAPEEADPVADRRPGREIELKLEFDPSDLEALRGHGVLRRMSQGRPLTSTLRSVYFDTSDLALYRSGIALRLRDASHGRVQTVKALGEGRAGLFDRAEDECAIPGVDPDITAIRDARLRTIVADATLQRGRSLERVVETEVQRSLRVLRCEQGEIELVIDVGEVRTHLGRIPVHEVELELRRGDPALLFDVALQLQETVALRPSAESKPERGFALLSGRPPSPRRAGRLLHEADASVDDLLAALFDDCIAQIAGNRVIARTGHDPSGVHQLRIGARRLRSALSLFRGLIPHELADPLRDELRWLGGSLGPARDLDVFATDLIEPLARARPEDGALKRLRDEALAARADAYDRVRDALDSPRYAQLVLMLGAIQSRRAWREQPLSEESARLFSPAREVAIGMLARRHKRVRRYGRRVASHSAAELHDLRIRLKKLRYATGFLLGLFAGKDERREASRYGRRVIELQDILGHLNDAITAEHVLDDLIARLADEAGPDHLRAAGFVVGWAARSAEFEMRRFDKRWRAFRKLRPFWER